MHLEQLIVCTARALFDYAGQNDEELTFDEGAIINILRKDDGEVDDGWWKGELNGHIGVFPSLLVEEMDQSLEIGDASQQYYAVPSHVYTEDDRTRKLYGTLPRNNATETGSSEQHVYNSLDLSVRRVPPTRPNLPQNFLQNSNESSNYNRNEYV